LVEEAQLHRKKKKEVALLHQRAFYLAGKKEKISFQKRKTS